MRTIRASVLALACVAAAHADFSYTQTRKAGPGTPGPAGEQASKHFLKGQKMRTDTGTTSMILDFDAQTITSINHQQKTYTVAPFGDLTKPMADNGLEARIDVKETGQKKNINGYNASEVLMTMEMDGPQTAQKGIKMKMEMSIWLSPDPPGRQELRAFYQRNSGKFPWTQMAAGSANSGMQKAMADMQKKMASLGGVPVMQVTRMKMAGNEQQTAQMQQGLEQLRARMEAMRKQGGAQAQSAEQALARMGGMATGFEMTMESTGFSTASIPDSVFAIPSGYQKQ
jgi:hypothetical protein